jgi:mannose-6-phosphate isomerase-like protein (cupin superfamily)
MKLPKKINISNSFERFSDSWNPRIIAKLNGQEVKIARLKGEFIRHSHLIEDEMFLVLEGSLTLEFDTGSLLLREGELAVVPAGLPHKPIAHGEAKVLLFEPRSTKNTGDMQNDKTRTDLEDLSND